MTRSDTGGYQPLTEREKWLTGQLVNSAISIHKTLGPGLLESRYEKCFCYALEERNYSLFEAAAYINCI